MNSTAVFLLILGMAIVTYIPRAIPAIFVGRLKFPPKVEKFLKLIPYTAMAALIFPGVFSADSERPIIGIVGGAVAGLLAWRKCPVMVCVLAAIGADFLLYTFL